MSVFDKHLMEIKDAFEKFPRKAGVIARKHFDENFTKKGFVNKKVTKWAPVKDHRKGASGNKSQPLVVSGRLRASIRYKVEGEEVVVYTEVPYAAVHNDGWEGNVKAHTRTMENGTTVNVKSHKRKVPQRQFIGKSAKLDEKLLKDITKTLKNILK